MKYLRYNTGDLINGEGVRCTLFLTGCDHGCKGCHNTHTWDHRVGDDVDINLILQICKDLKDHTGFSLTGGDPFFWKNRQEVEFMLKFIKAEHPDKDIWVWTGYTFDQIKDSPILQYVDVLIDGKYQKDNPTTKPWRGSDNQELIYLCKNKKPKNCPCQ